MFGCETTAIDCVSHSASVFQRAPFAKTTYAMLFLLALRSLLDFVLVGVGNHNQTVYWSVVDRTVDTQQCTLFKTHIPTVYAVLRRVEVFLSKRNLSGSNRDLAPCAVGNVCTSKTYMHTHTHTHTHTHKHKCTHMHTEIHTLKCIPL